MKCLVVFWIHWMCPWPLVRKRAGCFTGLPVRLHTLIH